MSVTPTRVGTNAGPFGSARLEAQSGRINVGQGTGASGQLQSKPSNEAPDGQGCGERQEHASAGQRIAYASSADEALALKPFVEGCQGAQAGRLRDCLAREGTTDDDSPFCAEKLGHSDTNSPEAQRAL